MPSFISRSLLDEFLSNNENIEELLGSIVLESICLHYRKLVKSFSVVVLTLLVFFSVAVGYKPLVI